MPINMKNRSRAWSRAHANGMAALVIQLPYEADHYAAGAIARTGAGELGDVRAPLQRAKADADEASGCKQPCTCPPWPE